MSAIVICKTPLPLRLHAGQTGPSYLSLGVSLRCGISLRCGPCACSALGLCIQLTTLFRMIGLNFQNERPARKTCCRNGCRLWILSEASVRTGNWADFALFPVLLIMRTCFLVMPLPLTSYLLKSHLWMVLILNPNNTCLFLKTDRSVCLQGSLATFTLGDFLANF